MHSKLVKIIGLMSGTSLDGLDIVYVEFDVENYENFKILYSETTSYTNKWKGKLASAIGFSKNELQQIDIEYGHLLAVRVADFIKKNAIKEIDFIASHGHTILHQPDKGVTLQIGNGQVLSSKTNCKVICDFRTQDVLFGGQGAPLVPIGDEMLFPEFDACLNLGGFANVSFKENDKRIAFDVCPVNIVLNYYVKNLGLEYDDAGFIASTGTINKQLLTDLNQLEFYQKKHPKSLGLEWVKEEIFPLIDSSKFDVKDVLKTVVEHVAFQVAKSTKGQRKILVTGGGVFNTFLMDRIRFYSKSKIVIPTSKIIDYKEALIFAFLGLLRSVNQVNCLSSVTGAKEDHSSGVLFSP